jgi:hypothetical protein
MERVARPPQMIDASDAVTPPTEVAPPTEEGNEMDEQVEGTSDFSSEVSRRRRMVRLGERANLLRSIPITQTGEFVREVLVQISDIKRMLSDIQVRFSVLEESIGLLP